MDYQSSSTKAVSSAIVSPFNITVPPIRQESFHAGAHGISPYYSSNVNQHNVLKKPDYHLDLTSEFHHKQNYIPELSEKVKQFEQEMEVLTKRVDATLNNDCNSNTKPTAEAVRHKIITKENNSPIDGNTCYSTSTKRITDNCSKSNYLLKSTSNLNNYNESADFDGKYLPQINVEECHNLRQELRLYQEKLEMERKSHSNETDYLKSRLYQHKLDTDSLENKLRQNQENSVEVTTHLKTQIIELTKVNTQLKDILLNAEQKLQVAQQDQVLLTSCVSQLKQVAMQCEKRRGVQFYDHSATELSANVLLHTIERAFCEIDLELQSKGTLIAQLQHDGEQIKREAKNEVEKVRADFTQSFAAIKKERDSLIKTVEEQFDSKRNKVTQLETQLQNLHEQYEFSLKFNTKNTAELEYKLETTENSFNKKHNAISQKCLALETSLEAVQRELTTTTSEKEELYKINKELKRELDYNVQYISDLEDQLKEAQQQSQDLYHHVQILENKLHDMESQLATCQRELYSTDERHARITKDQLDLELKQHQQEVDKLTRCVEFMQNSFRVLEDKYFGCEIDLENKNQIILLLEEKQTLFTIELQGLQEDKLHTQKSISHLQEDLSQVTQERDKYFKLLQEKSEQNWQLRTQLNLMELKVQKICELQEATPTTEGNAICSDDHDLIHQNCSQELQELHEANKILAKQIAEMQDKWSTINQENDNLKTQMFQIQSEKDAMKIRLSEWQNDQTGQRNDKHDSDYIKKNDEAYCKLSTQLKDCLEENISNKQTVITQQLRIKELTLRNEQLMKELRLCLEVANSPCEFNKDNKLKTFNHKRKVSFSEQTEFHPDDR